MPRRCAVESRVEQQIDVYGDTLGKDDHEAKFLYFPRPKPAKSRQPRSATTPMPPPHPPEPPEAAVGADVAVNLASRTSTVTGSLVAWPDAFRTTTWKR